MTRILLVDDHPLFLDGVRAALTGADDLEVVGEAHDGAAGIALAAELDPDVVLMDLNLPDLSGVDATGRILAAAPDTRVLMMTMSADDDAVVAAMRAGRTRLRRQGRRPRRAAARDPDRRQPEERCSARPSPTGWAGSSPGWRPVAAARRSPS